MIAGLIAGGGLAGAAISMLALYAATVFDSKRSARDAVQWRAEIRARAGYAPATA
jgi:hypothetical protein